MRLSTQGSNFSHPFWFVSFALLMPWLVALFMVSDIHESAFNTRIAWTLILSGLVLGVAHRVSARLVLLPLLIIGSVDLAYAISFKGIFSTATFEAIAATNLQESSEFVIAYISFWNTLGLIVYLGIGLALWLRMHSTGKSKWRLSWQLVSTLLLLLAITRIAQGQIHDTLPGVTGSAISYLQASEGVAKESAQREALVSAFDKSSFVSDAQAKTWLVVIGESMQRQHLSLYGYPRDTTPNLRQRKNELVILDNVISSHMQTQPSLRYALTLANVRDGQDPLQSLSIIDLANLAGMDTFWLSNQQPLRGTTSAIARQAKHEYYVSNDHAGIANTLDELLLPSIERALAHPAPQKLIVVHLMGSHLQYENRYPAKFAQFTDQPPRPYQTELSTRQRNSINAYDNSILYTDYVLNEILSLAHRQTQPTGLFYFSDHGEEVYDTKDFKGHGPESLTQRMFSIPFIVWGNDGMKTQQTMRFTQLAQAKHQAWKLDHFDQLLSQLLGWQYPQQRPQDSLADSQFIPSARIVYGKDFDLELNTR